MTVRSGCSTPRYYMPHHTPQQMWRQWLQILVAIIVLALLWFTRPEPSAASASIDTGTGAAATTTIHPARQSLIAGSWANGPQLPR